MDVYFFIDTDIIPPIPKPTNKIIDIKFIILIRIPDSFNILFHYSGMYKMNTRIGGACSHLQGGGPGGFVAIL